LVSIKGFFVLYIMNKILKLYNGVAYDTNSITVFVDKVPYKTVQKHNLGAAYYELNREKYILKKRITHKYTFKWMKQVLTKKQSQTFQRNGTIV